MNDTIYWIWLSILNLQQIQKIKLLEIFKNPKNIYKIPEEEIFKLTDSTKLIQNLTNTKLKKEAIEIYKKSKEENIKIITPRDNRYPKRLKQIPDYPIVLYLKGNIDLLNSDKTISIIGSRECSEYGRKITLNYSYQLARRDFTIVSGMAKGIDSYAHKGAIVAKGNTVAVLGSGINYIYPKENKKLYEKILESNGTIISEYPLNTIPMPENFPKRNRIISGMSDKILITEAGPKSGSMITADIGLEQGKDIYAIPGNITSYKSEGTNQLIKQGAFLVTSLEDILEL